MEEALGRQSKGFSMMQLGDVVATAAGELSRALEDSFSYSASINWWNNIFRGVV